MLQVKLEANLTTTIHLLRPIQFNIFKTKSIPTEYYGDIKHFLKVVINSAH